MSYVKKVSLLLEKLFWHKGIRTDEGSRLDIDCRRQGGRKYKVLAAGLNVDGGFRAVIGAIIVRLT